MITIATYTLPEEAHLVRMHLADAGIPAYVQDEHTIQLDVLYSNALGGVRLQVADEDVEAALEILQADRRAEAPEDSPRCPKCNAATVEPEKFSKRMVFASLLLLGFPLLFPKHRMRCLTCLHTWEP